MAIYFNFKMAGKDLLVVLSDSGKLSCLTFYNEMNRLFLVFSLLNCLHSGVSFTRLFIKE